MNLSEFLHQKGLRVTPLRMSLLESLKNADGPKTVTEMKKDLNKNGFQPNKTTLYRQIESLIHAGLVQEVQLKTGIQHYEMQVEHHHHFVCQKCDEIECIEDEPLENAIHSLEDQMKKRGMTVYEHNFSFTGICNQCIS